MRWWRRDSVGGLKARASLGLLLGGALTLAGCAASSANEAGTYLSAAGMSAESIDREGGGTAATAAQGEPSKSTGGGSASGSGGPLSALLSKLVGTPPHGSSPVDEEALIARAIAEHEMRNP